ncbi:hypothetical protein JXJ21_15765 [candidate division KSB1 bacterium]|nr:hypothetical protein [candidate division KSB1 bacterium]
MRTRCIILLGVFCIVFFIYCDKKSAPTEPEGDKSVTKTNFWKLKNKPMLSGKLTQSVTVNDKIYLIGGTSDEYGTEIYKEIEEYDPETESWITKSELPTKRWGFAACALDGKIYICGGVTSGGGSAVDSIATGLLEVYDPRTNRWETEKAPMNHVRMQFTLNAVNGKLYAIAGKQRQCAAVAQKVVEEYDPATDSWIKKKDMQTKRFGHTASVVDGKIYVIGGSNYGNTMYDGAIASVEIYDPAADTCIAAADMPAVRTGLRSDVIEGKIYAFGGAGIWTGPLKITEMYDPATDTWTEKADMKEARESHASGIFNGKIMALGGSGVSDDGAVRLKNIEEYTP